MNYVIINSFFQKTNNALKGTLNIYRPHSTVITKAINLTTNVVNVKETRLCYSTKLNIELCPKTGYTQYLQTFETRRQLLRSNYIFSSANSLRNSITPGGYWCTNQRNYSEQSVASKGVFYEALYNSSPVLFAQDCLLYIHNVTGLPWWATVVLCTVFLRTTITLPLSLYQSYILAKIENIQLELKELSKEMGRETSVAVKSFNWSEKQAKAVYVRSMKKQWKKLIIRENCHPAKASLLVLFQVPMWISLSLGLRNLVYLLPQPDIAAKVTLLELSGGGIFWFHNLALPDGTWMLPIILGLTNLTIIELQDLSKVKENSKFRKYITNFFRGVSIIMVPIAASVPSCLCLYWTTSSAVGLIHNLIQLSPRVRQICRIPETASIPKQPYKHIYEKLIARFGLPSTHPPTAS